MTKIDCVIETQVNEVYIKSIVTQNFINTSKEPLELKIGLRKDPNILFNCFQAKIGDSIIVNSKVISEEKAYIKYSDTIQVADQVIDVFKSYDLFDIFEERLYEYCFITIVLIIEQAELQF